jgi:hypothetical protein
MYILNKLKNLIFNLVIEILIAIKMNIKEELICQHCDQIYKILRNELTLMIYNHPVQLNYCGETICKKHIEDLIDAK